MSLEALELRQETPVKNGKPLQLWLFRVPADLVYKRVTNGQSREGPRRAFRPYENEVAYRDRRFSLSAETRSQDRLESWKEIATYLKREVRTVQRWEKVAGLPVHRLQIEKSGGVYAYKSELDAWWAERQPVLDPSEAPEQEKTPSSLRLWIGLAAATVALALATIIFLRARNASASKAPIVNSIAVLPLENLTGDASQEYLSDGMTDALITQLAQLPGLRVISRTSTIQYKGTHKTVPQIARELHVDAIVEGTVTRNQDSVRITAQLIHAPSDTHLWAGSVTGSRQDTLKLQGEVAEEISSKIGNRLSARERENLSKPITPNPQAYDAYLRGVYFLNKRTPDDTRTAIQHFQKAIAADAQFASAYALMADSYSFLVNTGEMSPAEGYRLGKQAAAKADELDDNLDIAHVALAVNAWVADWDWHKEESEFQRAIQINPNSAYARLGYSYVSLIAGKKEVSEEQLRLAKDLDPLSPLTMIVNIYHFYYLRQYDEALVCSRTGRDLYPQSPLFHVSLASVYAAENQDRLAADEMLLAEEYSGAPPERLASLRAVAATGGLRAMRERRIELNRKLLVARSPISPYDLAIDYAGVGNSDQTLLWLEKSADARDPKITLIAIEPIFDKLRKEPRFIALLRRMGLNQNNS